MTKARLKLNRRVFLAGSSATIVGASALGRAYAQGAALKVGVVLPTSGYLAQIGQACMRGAQLAVNVLKDMGYPAIEIMAGDSESSPDVSRASGERLINGGVHALTGAFDSGHTTTLAQVAEQRGIPLLINIAAAPPITEQGYKFVFRNFPRAPELTVGAFDIQKQIVAVSGRTPTKAVVLHRNDTYGSAMRAAFGAVAPQMNLPYPIVEYISYDTQARDLSVEVARAKATGAELVIAVSALNDAILLTREMVKQRFEPWGIVAAGPGWYDGPYMKTLGKMGNYPISAVPWYDPRKPAAQKMLDAHLKAFPGAAVDANAAYTFEALLVLADAYKRARSTTPQALADAIRATDIKANDSITIGDGVKFDAKGQNNSLKVAGIQNFDGEAKVALPLSSAERNLAFPVPGWRNRG